MSHLFRTLLEDRLSFFREKHKSNQISLIAVTLVDMKHIFLKSPSQDLSKFIRVIKKEEELMKLPWIKIHTSTWGDGEGQKTLSPKKTFYFRS
jgi:hypothetical protein